MNKRDNFIITFLLSLPEYIRIKTKILEKTMKKKNRKVYNSILERRKRL